MSDVVLIYPKAGHDVRGVSVNAPLALLSLAAFLEPDFKVQIIDQRACDDFWGDVERAIATKPLLIGITSMTGTQIYHGLEITKFIKARSSVPIVWGGMHPTIYPAQTVVKPYIDFVIKGEGEVPLRALVEALAAKRTGLEDVPSLIWKRDGRIYGNPEASPLDLDLCPPLPWHLVDVEEYIAPSHYLYPGVTRLLPYQASRGCPYKCTFCSQPALTKRYRMMRPKKVVDELVDMVERFNLDHISFFDDEFFANTKWAMEVAEGIGGRFTWFAQTRAADVMRMDLKRLEKLGLNTVAPGLESGSDRILKYVKKGETTAEYRQAHSLLMPTKFTIQYNFMTGFPTETEEELNETVDLVLELLESSPNTIINQLSPFTPLPGTQLLREVVLNHGFQEPKRLEEWAVMTRGRQDRPWMDEKRMKLVRFLYYTSLFLCSAERYSQRMPIPSFIFKLYSASVRKRWRHKLYWMNLDIPILRLLFRLFINPVDYTLDIDKYGDHHTASESEIIHLRPGQEPAIPS